MSHISRSVFTPEVLLPGSPVWSGRSWAHFPKAVAPPRRPGMGLSLMGAAPAPGAAMDLARQLVRLYAAHLFPVDISTPEAGRATRHFFAVTVQDDRLLDAFMAAPRPMWGRDCLLPEGEASEMRSLFIRLVNEGIYATRSSPAELGRIAGVVRCSMTIETREATDELVGRRMSDGMCVTSAILSVVIESVWGPQPEDSFPLLSPVNPFIASGAPGEKLPQIDIGGLRLRPEDMADLELTSRMGRLRNALGDAVRDWRVGCARDTFVAACRSCLGRLKAAGLDMEKRARVASEIVMLRDLFRQELLILSTSSEDRPPVAAESWKKIHNTLYWLVMAYKTGWTGPDRDWCEYVPVPGLAHPKELARPAPAMAGGHDEEAPF